MLKKIAVSAGLLPAEAGTVIILLLILITGLAGRFYFSGGNSSLTVKSDYRREDSLFINGVNISDSIKIPEKSIDYESKLLDFSDNKFYRKKHLPAEESIDINKADASTLESLPGIGPKTAEKILLYRKIFGKFLKKEDIKKVKGIGEKKYNSIKKYIYIEK